MSSWKQLGAARAHLSRETGAIHKDPGGKLTIALAYPNSYHVGMSSLALQILYRTFNARTDVACERVFWDAEAAKARQPLLTLESSADVSEFGVWAFTISYEMDYFNVVAMLKQAGVPCLARDRAEGQWPLLIAGGPGVTMNPEPMAPFFDAMVIGEAEEMADGLLDVLAGGIYGDREALLTALDRLPGVYVPARLAPGQTGRRIERLWVRNMARIEPVSCLYSPDTEFGGMHLIEIARGCGRGCRFCLAGYVYRPPREQSLERILGWAAEALERDEPVRGIGLVSAAVSDHSQIDELATELQARGARISVSSMRTDPISVPLVKAMAAGGAQTLTIAPEAGSERLRRTINKSQTEESLLAAVELAQSLAFAQLKLYFMIGHPTEQDEDIEAIVALTLKAKALFRRNITINATPFVPKAHTPFERVAMMPARTLDGRQAHLKRALARHQVNVRFDSPSWAQVQAVLARGDRRLAPVLIGLEQLSVRGFFDALTQHGLTADEYLQERPANVPLPWRIVEGGVNDSFLARERSLAEQSALGARCPARPASCHACGVCATEQARLIATAPDTDCPYCEPELSPIMRETA